MPRIDGPAFNGAALHALRASRGASQTTIARAAKIDVSYVSRLERGIQQHPSRRVVRRIAKALDVPTDALQHLEGAA